MTATTQQATAAVVVTWNAVQPGDPVLSDGRKETVLARHRGRYSRRHVLSGFVSGGQLTRRKRDDPTAVRRPVPPDIERAVRAQL